VVAGALEHKTLSEAVLDALRELIFTGQLRAGDRLFEDRLAERLGVSRNPVREAIHAMAATGLVEIVPRKGAYVATFNREDVEGIQEVRRVLERWVVATAAARHDDHDIAAIDRCIEVGRAASAAGDATAATTAHQEFHRAIEQATKNPFVALAMAPLRQRTDLIFSVLANRRDSHETWDEHERIRDAIARRDPLEASSLIDAHITATLRAFAVETAQP
jgi:DNA-binding GntR family transcriptional regulator